VVRQLHADIPMLGICLGHQVIAKALGGQIIRAAEPIHGRPWQIEHDGRGVFAGLPKTITAGRYHSLVVDEASLPECLEISARAADGTIMAIRHRRLPLVGLQFHPESILTEFGYPLLGAFLKQIGLTVAEPLPTLADERMV
ncbi:MAG: gamma-glutamyl-gamma-aminobutyrate hydrolase family protein, partial [Pirellulales bacterium]|nr:gamma-glutamyl-gamma-aminobutyrate hydrolase family protein [Pirellulales bacterium]